jgi:hypothetical protein
MSSKNVKVIVRRHLSAVIVELSLGANRHCCYGRMINMAKLALATVICLPCHGGKSNGQ